jgi:hypothetical protein
MTTKQKALIGSGIGAVILIAGFLSYWFFVRVDVNEQAVVPALLGEPTSEDGTESGGAAPAPAVAVTPTTGTSVDAYSYTDSGAVFFKSVTSTSTLAIPGANADTFHRITDFMTYPDQEVADKCGAKGEYAYYADKNRVYFYQVWKTPKFRASKVEVIIDEKEATFKVLSPVTAEGATMKYVVGYQVATSTCQYVLQGSKIL